MNLEKGRQLTMKQAQITYLADSRSKATGPRCQNSATPRDMSGQLDCSIKPNVSFYESIVPV